MIRLSIFVKATCILYTVRQRMIVFCWEWISAKLASRILQAPLLVRVPWGIEGCRYLFIRRNLVSWSSIALATVSIVWAFVHRENPISIQGRTEADIVRLLTLLWLDAILEEQAHHAFVSIPYVRQIAYTLAFATIQVTFISTIVGLGTPMEDITTQAHGIIMLRLVSTLWTRKNWVNSSIHTAAQVTCAVAFKQPTGRTLALVLIVFHGRYIIPSYHALECICITNKHASTLHAVLESRSRTTPSARVNATCAFRASLQFGTQSFWTLVTLFDHCSGILK
jgi:hypothetical protein